MALRQEGFTTIELMIVVTILVIMASIGAPSMLGMIKTSKLRAVASDYYSALLSARSESIKRRTNVTLAPVGADWSTGWTVKAGTTTLASHEALASDVSVQVNVPATSTINPIVYGSNGRVTSSAPTLIFYNASDSSVEARCVSVDPAGMPRVRTDTNSTASDGCN